MAEQTSSINHLIEPRRIPSILPLLVLSLVSISINLNAQSVANSGSTMLAAGIDCLDEEEFPLAVVVLTEAHALAKKENDTKSLVDALFYLSQAEFWLANYPVANEHLYLLLNDYPASLNRADSMSILRLISQNHFYMGNFDLAHELALERLRYTEELKDSFNIAKSYQVLGEIECRQKDYAEALKYVELSQQLFEKIGDNYELSFNLDLMGDIFHNTGKYEEALAYKIKSCTVIDTTGSLYNNAYCNHTIAITLSKMGKYDEAISLFKLALARWVKAGMPEETALTRACLGETIAWSGQCSIGISQMEQALEETKELSLSPLARDILEKLFQTSKHCGQIEAAFEYLEQYQTVFDSLNNQNTLVRIASLSNNYQLEKKNAELEALKQTERIKAQFIVFLLVGMALLVGLAFFIYNLLKKQRKNTLLLDKKSKQIAQQFEDLHQANEKLELANKDLEQFAYLASHDLKTPLRTIGNYASLINRRYADKLDENGITFLNFITEAIRHMNVLLEDIFAYSKAGKDETKKTEVNMQEKLQLALQLLQETIESKHAKVQYDQLPVITGNATQLYQLIQNLLDNALKFIPEGRNPVVKITCVEEGNGYHFSFSDNGIGIAENKHEEVFTIFKRLHSKEEYSGTGIGLAICKKIVESHGGRIWIASDGETGTTFHFTLKKSIEETAQISA